MSRTVSGRHGGEVLRIAREHGLRPEDFLDASNNANTLAADLTQNILERIPYPFLHYPEATCAELRHALADYEGLSAAHFLVSNGSSESLYLVLQALRPRRVLLVTPLFSEYARACEALGIAFEQHILRPENDFLPDRDTFDALAAPGTDLVILCTPNNPTCSVLDGLSELLELVNAPYCLVDTAYKEFLYGTPSFEKHFYRNWRADKLRTQPIALCSFTKYFCCTGLRLGYLAAAPELIETMLAVRPPWMVSRYAELAGLRFLERLESYRALMTALDSARVHLAGLVRTCGLFDVVRSGPVNFLLCRLTQTERALEYARTLEKQGILVRVCDNITGMEPGYFRIQVRTPDENLLVYEAFQRLAAKTLSH